MMTPELFFGLGALVLLVALIYGVVQTRRRNRANDPVTEAATRAEYDRPATYEDERPKYVRKTRPS